MHHMGPVGGNDFFLTHAHKWALLLIGTDLKNKKISTTGPLLFISLTQRQPISQPRSSTTPPKWTLGKRADSDFVPTKI